MARLIQLEIVTPEKIELTAQVEMVIVPGVDGEFGVLPGHAPLVTEIVPGVLRVFETAEDGTKKEVHLANSTGFVEVKDDKVIILADTAELPEEIDLERAQQAKKRAEERLAKRGQDNIDSLRAEMALKRAIIRLKVGAERRI